MGRFVQGDQAMKEARDHARVSPEGKKAGATTAMLADKMCARLAAEDEPDERCKTCAFRAGTVPNGCAQTQLDVIKAVNENVPFMCHQKPRRICHGWYAVSVLARRMEEATGQPLPKCDWEFSPPDEAGA
jgi:hypothetical protein